LINRLGTFAGKLGVKIKVFVLKIKFPILIIFILLILGNLVSVLIPLSDLRVDYWRIPGGF
jgi:hypothetical protein